MIDMVIFMRRFGNDLLNGTNRWVNHRMASTVMYQVMTTVTDWCSYIFGDIPACVRLDQCVKLCSEYLTGFYIISASLQANLGQQSSVGDS